MTLLDLAVPDHGTPSRRTATVALPRPRACPGAGPFHLSFDSAGLKLCGAGEWSDERHGTRVRRSWRDLHSGLDAGTGRTVASPLTPGTWTTARRRPPRSTGSSSRSPPSPATAPMARTASPPTSTPATRMPPSSCRRAPPLCRARRPRPRPRSATATSAPSSSTAARRGRRRPAAPNVPGPRRPCRASSG